MTDQDQKQIFEQWLHEHRSLIFKIVRAYSLTIMDQDDLFQEIIIQLWHSVPSFRQEAAVTTWIFRISLNVAIKWTRSEQKHKTETLKSIEHVLSETKQPIDQRLVWLYEEIHKLDQIDRSIALLLLDGFSYKEMAAILGITESNVGVKINRIKKLLIAKSKNHDYHGV